MLESTVVQQETRQAADIVFVPNEALSLAIGVPPSPSGLLLELGLVAGVPIQTADDMKDVFFASMTGLVRSPVGR